MPAPLIVSAVSGEACIQLGRAFFLRNQHGCCPMRGLLLPSESPTQWTLVLRFKRRQFRRVLSFKGSFKGLVIMYLMQGAPLTSTPVKNEEASLQDVTMETLQELILMPVLEMPALLAQAPRKDPPVCMGVVL